MLQKTDSRAVNNSPEFQVVQWHFFTWNGQIYNRVVTSFLKISYTKNCRNRLIFDWVIQKIKGWRFWDTLYIVFQSNRESVLLSVRGDYDHGLWQQTTDWWRQPSHILPLKRASNNNERRLRWPWPHTRWRYNKQCQVAQVTYAYTGKQDKKLCCCREAARCFVSVSS